MEYLCLPLSSRPLLEVVHISFSNLCLTENRVIEQMPKTAVAKAYNSVSQATLLQRTEIT